MLLVQYTYPFDPNGTATTNKVVGERHTITPVNGPDFRFLIPRAAPYFKSSIQLLHVASNTPLLEGIHWAAGHKFDRASNTAPFLAVYGSVLILDNTIEGVIELTQYQTLGGEFTINEAAALELLANAQLDPRLAKWDNVLNAPTTYDPLLHRHHASESTGYEDMVGTLNRLADAIIANLGQSSVDQVARSHISNTNNPHNTTLAQLPDAQHLINLTPQRVQDIINIINNGGSGGIDNELDPIALERLRWKKLDTGPMPINARVIPNNADGPVIGEVPTNPANYTYIEWAAGPVSFETHSFTIQPTDAPINGSTTPIVIDTKGECGMLIYFAELGQWLIYRTGIAAGGNGGFGGAARDPGGMKSITANDDMTYNATHVFLAGAELQLLPAPINTLAEFAVSSELDLDTVQCKVLPVENETVLLEDGTVVDEYILLKRVYPDRMILKRTANGWKQI